MLFNKISIKLTLKTEIPPNCKDASPLLPLLLPGCACARNHLPYFQPVPAPQKLGKESKPSPLSSPSRAAAAQHHLHGGQLSLSATSREVPPPAQPWPKDKGIPDVPLRDQPPSVFEFFLFLICRTQHPPARPLFIREKQELAVRPVYLLPPNRLEIH